MASSLGHMLALLDLTGLLASCGLRLTVVATPATAPQLAPLLAAHLASAVLALTLPFPAHHALTAGVESAKHLPRRSSPRSSSPSTASGGLSTRGS
uniref:Uncharacterized protein n=1 Tax=Setaria italica TaxID=4555 RepID=A0A0Q3V0T6_SETIT